MKQRVGLWAIAGLVAIACAKRADEAPSQTAASEAPAPAAVPASPEAPAPPPAPAEPEPGAGATPPTSLGGEDESSDRGLKKGEEEPKTLAEAEALLKTSSQDLEKLIGPLKADKATGGAPPAPLASGDARCPKACKAFDSLKRAGDAICRLAGDADARCTRAKDMVKQNAARVSVCGC
jgi:hypothetical protein